MKTFAAQAVVGAAVLMLALSGCKGPDAGLPEATGVPPSASVTPLAAEAAPTPEAVIQRHERLRFDSRNGNPTLAMRTAGERLNDYINLYPDVFSGAWWATDYSAFEVGVARSKDPAAAKYEELRKELDPGLKFTKIHQVRYSLTELLEIQQEIMHKYLGKGTPTVGGVVSLGPDPVNSYVVVEILRTDIDPVLEQFKVVQELVAKYGNQVAFEETGSTNAILDAAG